MKVCFSSNNEMELIPTIILSIKTTFHILSIDAHIKLPINFRNENYF